MTEHAPNYGSTERIPTSLEGFKNLPCANNKHEWTAPTPEQIKALLALSGLNKRQWAELLGVTYTEKHGSTTLRKWTAKRESKDSREISYSVWRLMLIYTGVVAPSDDIEHVKYG